MKYLIAIILLASTAFAQNNSGTLVIAPIRPQASNDTFPSAIANEIKGGPFSVGTTAAMSNIPSERLVSGSTAYITNDSTLRLWNGSNWSSDNFRTAIGLGSTNSPTFEAITLGSSGISVGTSGARFSQSAGGGGAAIGWQGNAQRISFLSGVGMTLEDAGLGIAFGASNTNGAAITRTNLGLGATNNVVFNSIHAEQSASTAVYSLTIGQTNTGFRGIGGGPNDFVYTRDGANILGLYSGKINSLATHEFLAPLVLVYGSGGNNAVLQFGGSDPNTGAAISRTNLGLGWSALTNTNASGFRNAIELSSTNNVTFNRLIAGATNTPVNSFGYIVAQNGSGEELHISSGGFIAYSGTNVLGTFDAETRSFSAGEWIFEDGIDFNTVSAATTRTNLGLGWSALTNSNSGNALLAYTQTTNPTSTVIGPTNSNAVLRFTNQVSVPFLSVSNDADTVATFARGAGYPSLDVLMSDETLNAGYGDGDFAIGVDNLGFAVKYGTNLNDWGYPVLIDDTGTSLLKPSSTNFRTALGLGATWLTNTNVTNFRTAIGLGSANTVNFVALETGDMSYNNSGPSGYARDINFEEGTISGSWSFISAVDFTGTNVAAITRTNLGLGLPVLTNTNNANFLSDLGIGTNSSPTFSNVTLSNLLITGNFTNQGTIYGLKTNVGPFEGVGNFFASNNTTVSNETLFRVGLAEENNRSAQFGFRVARTNNGGEGFAVFSVYGYNALMMIGPSDVSRSNSLTNTNAAIEADIWSISPTNRVMTLITTDTGAMQMHRPIGFNTNNILTTAPSNTTVTNPTGWIEFYVGTNSVRVPYYQ